jgi:hypothetical protein
MDDSLRNSLRHGSTRIFTDQIKVKKSVKIRVNPWPGFLRSPSGKRQQRDVPRLLDGQGQTSLVRSANPGQTPRDDLAALRHELREQPDIFVIDGLNFLYAELANLLAAKIFAPTFAATRASGTWRTAFPIGTISERRTITGRPISTHRTLPTRTCCCCRSNFFSHDAP